MRSTNDVYRKKVRTLGVIVFEFLKVSRSVSHSLAIVCAYRRARHAAGLAFIAAFPALGGDQFQVDPYGMLCEFRTNQTIAFASIAAQ
jgi:hypothetical protein